MTLQLDPARGVLVEWECVYMIGMKEEKTSPSSVILCPEKLWEIYQMSI